MHSKSKLLFCWHALIFLLLLRCLLRCVLRCWCRSVARLNKSIKRRRESTCEEEEAAANPWLTVTRPVTQSFNYIDTNKNSQPSLCDSTTNDFRREAYRFFDSRWMLIAIVWTYSILTIKSISLLLNCLKIALKYFPVQKTKNLID